MDQNQRLYQAIEEGVSKGVPMDFIAYSLTRAGWPNQVVEQAIGQWRQANGREQKSTLKIG
jgi:hypothetical protein